MTNIPGIALAKAAAIAISAASVLSPCAAHAEVHFYPWNIYSPPSGLDVLVSRATSTGSYFFDTGSFLPLPPPAEAYGNYYSATYYGQQRHLRHRQLPPVD